MMGCGASSPPHRRLADARCYWHSSRTAAPRVTMKKLPTMPLAPWAEVNDRLEQFTRSRRFFFERAYARRGSLVLSMHRAQLVEHTCLIDVEAPNNCCEHIDVIAQNRQLR